MLPALDLFGRSGAPTVIPMRRATWFWLALIAVVSAVACGGGDSSSDPNLPTGSIRYADSAGQSETGKLIVTIQGSPDQLRLTYVEMVVVSPADVGYSENMEFVGLIGDEATYSLSGSQVDRIVAIVGATDSTHTITLATDDGRAFAAEVTLDPTSEAASATSTKIDFAIVDAPIID